MRCIPRSSEETVRRWCGLHDKRRALARARSAGMRLLLGRPLGYLIFSLMALIGDHMK